MDTVDQMNSFVGIVDAGSLSAAARKRRMSLAAISRQLSALESELGVPLIVRTTRRLQVTEAGRRWYEHCRRLLRELADARSDVASGGDVRGTVVISAPITVGLELVVPKLTRLAREHPRLEVELRLEDHVIDLVGENVDIAVRGGFTPPDSASLIAHPLATFHRIAVAAPSYLARRGTPRHPRELATHDGLVQHGLTAAFTAWRFARGDEVVDVTPKARLRATAPIVLRAWAEAGAGIALIPEWLVDPASRRLRRVLGDWTSNEVRVWALHRIELRGAPRIAATIAALSG